MVRDILVELYLFFFKIQFTFLKLFPIKNKVTFVASFGENSLYVYQAMKNQGRNEQVIFLKKKPCAFSLEELKGATVINFETVNPIAMVRSIYHLATSKYIIVDNYYGFLAAANFKKEVEVIQLWHAVGAIKSFGLKDLTISNRSNIAKRRFIAVYKRFHKIVVGSEEMANIFIEVFNVDPSVILRTGIPRTDIFFDTQQIAQLKRKLYEQNSKLRDKKVLLYAPTYRDGQINNFKIELDIKKLYTELGDEYVLLLKLHPVIKNNAKSFEEQYEGFVFDYSSYKKVNDLLFITDILITDYSSIHYEYALLKKPIIFFAYDVEEYKENRGMIGDYLQEIPGPLAKTTDEIIHFIKNKQFNLEEVNEFAKKWNRYSRGDSSSRLIHYMFHHVLQEKQSDVL